MSTQTLEEITSEGLENNFYEIMLGFVDLFKEHPIMEKEYPLHLLILMKIASNLVSSNILWARGRFEDARVILRSAFESLVLLEYLNSHKEEVATFEKDAEITKFQNHVAFVNRGYSPYETIAKHYDSLSKEVKAFLPLESEAKGGIIAFDIAKLNTFFRKNFRPLSQQTRKMMNELIKIGSPNSKMLDEVSVTIYGLNSQIAHGTLDTLLETFTQFPTEDDSLRDLRECYRQSMVIITVSLKILPLFIGELKAGQAESLRLKIVGMYKYLRYDLGKYDSEKITLSEVIQQVCS